MNEQKQDERSVKTNEFVAEEAEKEVGRKTKRTDRELFAFFFLFLFPLPFPPSTFPFYLSSVFSSSFASSIRLSRTGLMRS